MCGIIGQICYRGIIDREEFVRMRDTLSHRGPDGAGNFFDDSEQVALGHRRLSFLDLSESGQQPMPNEDGTLWLTFNGEIYNYVELRSRLEAKGHRFRSTSDTETILHGYEEWGPDVLSHLKGMFAIGIYDTSRRELFLARDRFGIKPLYYYRDASTFMFASEIKALVASKRMRRSLRYESIHDYLAYRFVPTPWTIWRNVFKVPPANYLLHRHDGTISVREYWSLPIDAGVDVDRRIAVERVDELLEKSVCEHLRSDVRVGAFLSGGYDSSALVQYMKRLEYPRRTFAIGFEGWDDSEHKYASQVAQTLQSEHTNHIVDQCSLNLVEKLMYFYDEPIADISIIPTYLVSQVASQSVKAVLSGEGADEMFCGYGWQRAFALDQAQRPRNGHAADAANQAADKYAEYMAMGRFRNTEIRRLLHPDLAPADGTDSDWWYRSLSQGQSSPVKSMQYLDIKSFMAELVLTKVDRASMANSLEVRVPFLDHELFEYVISLQDQVYFDPGKTKVLLRHILEPVLPKTIIDRPKQGFVGPNRYYMNTGFYTNVIKEGRLLQDHVIRREYVDELIRANDHWRLWKIMVLEFWYQRWMQPGLTLSEPQIETMRIRTSSPSPAAIWNGTDGFSLTTVFRSMTGARSCAGVKEETKVHAKSYIICGAQCAGASLLSRGLAETGLAGNPQEFLQCRGRDNWNSSRPLWLENENVPEMHGGQPPRTINQFLDLVRAVGTRGETFGLVLMWTYFTQVITNLRRLREFRGKSEKEILDAAFGNPCFIWLARRDPLQQAAAWSRASQTGIWSEDATDQRDTQTAEFKSDNLKFYYDKVVEAQEGWRSFFDRSGVCPLEFTYEDLVGDFQATLRQAVDFVGVSVESAALERFVPQPVGSCMEAEWAERYRELNPQ